MIRDQDYLDWLKTERCILTGQRASDHDAVDPTHIGTAGKSIKSSDDEALPLLHSLHVEAHQKGEMTTFRRLMPDWLLHLCLRAYAREMYREWKANQPRSAA